MSAHDVNPTNYRSETPLWLEIQRAKARGDCGCIASHHKHHPWRWRDPHCTTHNQPEERV